nr:glycoside hydrolase family 43 protein [Aquibacillus kalidii]
MKRKKIYLIMIVVLLVIAAVGAYLFFTNSESSSNMEPPTFTEVSVHDPSIVKDGDTYYVFGSHIESAKSTDLMNWTRFTNGYETPNNTLYGDLSQNLAESFKWAGENDSDSTGGYAVWAPDVFYNEDYLNEDGSKGAYMIYYSVSSTYIRSAIGYAVSQNIEGPYTYVDTIVYSGFTEDEGYDENSNVNKKWSNTNIQSLIENGTLEEPNENWFRTGGSYNNREYPNAIDANLFYDEEDKLWMTYGSWSGGIFIYEIDPQTGQPIYPKQDGTTEDGRMIDRYFGTKISGGYEQSGEGPYVVYDKETKYYYLYKTYGYLDAAGAYNMRQFRSTNPDGPYVDAAGNGAVLEVGQENAEVGNKLIGNYMFNLEDNLGAEMTYGYVSPGHNSVLYDQETKKQFLVFHTRFPETGEMHEVRVHQMFMNKNDWPVVAPYRYSGESVNTEIKKKEVVGEYKLINHGHYNFNDIVAPELIELNKDGSISGSVEGSWSIDNQYASLTIDDITYDGVFIAQWDPLSETYVMTFTALSNEGISIWGSMTPDVE